MRKLLLTTALVAASMTAQAADLSGIPAGTYELDKTHASLVWRVNHVGLSEYTARFNDFDATIELDTANPTASKVTATIDPRSIKTGYPYPEEKDFDAELATGSNWFNADVYPELRFESTELTMTGENTGTMQGTLTMLGMTQPVTLNVELIGATAEKPFAGVPALGFKATGELTRSDWGFDTYVPSIGDVVTFRIDAEFHHVSAE